MKNLSIEYEFLQVQTVVQCKRSFNAFKDTCAEADATRGPPPSYLCVLGCKKNSGDGGRAADAIGGGDGA